MTGLRSRFLVSGANGFVGQHLCAELQRRGCIVRAAVRSMSPPIENAEVVTVGAIDGETDWTSALQDVDVVIHLAARVHVMVDRATDPLAEFLRVNLDGTVNFARQAAAAGVGRFVFVSSIKVNGENTHPLNGRRHKPAGTEGDELREVFAESDIPCPQDPYGISKWQAEQALQRMAPEAGMETVIVRPPLVYGPGVKGNFISLFAAIDKGIPLPLAGAANARSMIYVGNLADALILCATHPAAAGHTYLLCDGGGVSTAELVDRIAQSLGCRNRCFYFPPSLLRAVAALLGRSAQLDRLLNSLLIDDGRIRRELEWMPPYSMEQGLSITARWYRDQRLEKTGETGNDV